jgi:hypothetical protein
MQLQTFETLAKWIGERTGATVEFSDVGGPVVDLNTNVIKIPANLKAGKELEGLATIFHEAAHMRYTKIGKDPDADKLEDFILNFAEDMRINRKLIADYRNAHAFFDAVYAEPPGDDKLRQTMLYLIGEIELYNNSKFASVREMRRKKYATLRQEITDCNLRVEFENLVQRLRYQTNDDERKGIFEQVKTIKEILKKFLNIPEEPPAQPQPQPQQSESGKGQKGEDDSPGEQQEDEEKEDGEQDAGAAEEKQNDKIAEMLQETKDGISGYKKYFKPSEFSLPMSVQAMVMLDNTKEAIRHALTVKNKITVSGDQELSPRLESFFVGNVDELFEQHKKERIPSTKVYFLLDKSGSMARDLRTDGKSRRDIVRIVMGGMIKFLDEIKEQTNVAYDLYAFDTDLRQIHGMNEYGGSGGTCMSDCFKQLLAIMQVDDRAQVNKKIVLVMTDAEVDASDVDMMKKLMTTANLNSTCAVVGIGIQKAYHIKNLTGGLNIKNGAEAQTVIYDTFLNMIGG